MNNVEKTMQKFEYANSCILYLAFTKKGQLSFTYSYYFSRIFTKVNFLIAAFRTFLMSVLRRLLLFEFSCRLRTDIKNV